MLKVGLTRSEEDIGKDRKVFEREGFEVIAIPLIQTKPLEFELQKDIFDYVIFQSEKAVRYFLSRERLRGDEKIIAVGEATKISVERYGYKVHHVPERHYASEILKIMEGRRGKVLIPRSREGRDELIKGLRSMGFDVYTVDAYTTQKVVYTRKELLIKLSEADVLVFASPSAIKSLFANLQKKESIKVLKGKVTVCIGKTTKEEFFSLSGLDCLMPEKPSMESIANLLRELVQSLQNNN
ncbi:MAG: uroporphyrinogen-III synthase [Aquificaceae bacterium]